MKTNLIEWILASKELPPEHDQTMSGIWKTSDDLLVTDGETIKIGNTFRCHNVPRRNCRRQWCVGRDIGEFKVKAWAKIPPVSLQREQMRKDHLKECRFLINGIPLTYTDEDGNEKEVRGLLTPAEILFCNNSYIEDGIPDRWEPILTPIKRTHIPLSPYVHELNSSGTACANDCPACKYAQEHTK